MNPESIDYEVGLRERLADPGYAAAYLSSALEDGSREVFLLALKDVAHARGMAWLAREADLNRENLYRILSQAGNPQLSSLEAILDALDLRLAVEPKPTAA